jgi:hypothetical protein
MPTSGMPTAGPQQVDRFADTITALVDDAIAEGAVPANVRSFADLHSYLDANDFLQDAQVRYDGSDTAVALMAAVEAEVTRRLSAPTRPYCTFGRCTYPGHDHTTHEDADGELLAVPGPLRCLDCGYPAHNDAKLQRLRHDDPVLDARRCPTTTSSTTSNTATPAAQAREQADRSGWVDAWVAAAVDPGCYDFGPYRTQVTHLPDRPGERVNARFGLDAMRRIAEEQLYAAGRVSMGVAIAVERGEVRDRSVWGRTVPAGSDGWWHLDDEPWSWVLSDLRPEHPLWQPLFAPVQGSDEGRRCTVCGAVDDIDTTFVPSRLGGGFDDGIDRCRRCGATQVDNAEVRARTERAPWPAPAPGPVGADGTAWDGREGLPGGWWRLPCEVGLRVRTVVRALDGLMLSTDLRDGFGQPGPVFVDLKALTAWDTGRDDASRARTVFEALDARFPGRFTTVLDLDQPGTVFLTLPLLSLTDEVADEICDNQR